MKSINVKVDDRARAIIDRYQEDRKITSLDNAVSEFIVEKGGEKRKSNTVNMKGA